MAALTTQQVPVTGLEASYASAAAGGDTVEAGDGIFVHVKNADASDKTVTVAVPGSEYGQARPDVAVVVTAGEQRFIQIPRALADSSDNRVHLTYSAVTSVTIAALKV
jgi:hypothetical protein